MTQVDWIIVVSYCLLMLGIGFYFRRRAERGVEGYFIAGRQLPWWILGFSAVATYSCAGAAPGFTMLVYEGGLMGNWWWWLPWVIWMPLVAVIWSKFWRRLGLVTTAEFIEVRYSGRPAAIYRAIYALFLCFGWAVILMGYVTGWLTRAMSPILGWEPVQLILFCGIIALGYTVTAGLFGVAYSDAPQFLIFLVSNLVFVPIVIGALGGLGEVYSKAVALRGDEFLKPLPPGGDLIPLTLLALGVQGLFLAASPAAGEGFTAQRFMAAKNEFHAQAGQMFNAVLSLIVRVIPFIFIGIAGAALFPKGQVEGARVWGLLVSRYSLVGLTGLLIAAELAAYMSTIDTEMNWGASYLINDLYKRFLKPAASVRHYILVSRVATFAMLALALLVAHFLVKGMMAWFLFINSVMVAFILPLSWLRFFWWRLNIYGEAAAVIVGMPLGYIIWFTLGFNQRPFWQGFSLLFVAGWVVILLATYLTPPESLERLRDFYRRCKPPGLWGPVARNLPVEERSGIAREAKADVVDAVIGVGLCASAVACMCYLFAAQFTSALIAGLLAGLFAFILVRRWARRGVFKQIRG